MTEDIQFKKYDAANHDLNCAEGELRPPIGLIAGEDGRLVSAPNLNQLATLPEGITPIYIHNNGDTTNLLATDGSVLLWAPMSNKNTYIAPDSFTIISPVTDIKDVALLNDRIIIATESGLLYLSFSENGYSCVSSIKIPDIEFGLQKAGNLSNATTLLLQTALPETVNGTQPNITETGASMPNISEKVADIFAEAVNSQIITKGYFHMPFFIKYAIRLYDGSHIMASSPILMLPTVLPPCIALTITTDQNEGITKITPSLSRILYHQLRYRVRSADIKNLKSAATAIDVFATTMIPTYDTSLMNKGYITTYSSVIKAGLHGPRGRQPINLNDDTAIFDGHYSTSADNFTDQYLEQSVKDSTALMVYPNNQFYNRIVASSEYHLIASLPLDCLSENEEFAALPLNSLPADQTSKKELDTDLLSFFNIKATALRTINGNLMVAANTLIPKQEIPLGLPYYSASSSNETYNTEITVHIKNGSQNCRIKYVKQLSYSLSSHFPRYLFFPHSGAYKLSFRQGESEYGLDLTPHPSQKGAYWYGGIDHYAGSTPSSPDTTISDSSPYISTSLILVSATNNPFVFDESCAVSLDGTRITGIAEATKAPKYGTFGKYPAYVFTTSGIWMLEYSNTQQKYVSLQKISRDVCPVPMGIAEATESIFFSTDSKIKLLDGTDFHTISNALELMTWNVTTLPHYEKLLKIGKMEQIGTTMQDIIKNCNIAYLSPLSILLISPKNSGYTLAYKSGAWSILDFNVSCVIKNNSSCPYLFNYDGSLFTIGEHASKEKSLIVSRPIKSKNRTIKSVKILGNFSSNHVAVALFGAQTYGEWHLCSSSLCHYVPVCSTDTFNLYTIVIISELRENEYITGATIEYSDSI